MNKMMEEFRVFDPEKYIKDIIARYANVLFLKEIFASVDFVGIEIHLASWRISVPYIG